MRDSSNQIRVTQAPKRGDVYFLLVVYGEHQETRIATTLREARAEARRTVRRLGSKCYVSILKRTEVYSYWKDIRP